jgi:hypothetical protein
MRQRTVPFNLKTTKPGPRTMSTRPAGGKGNGDGKARPGARAPSKAELRSVRSAVQAVGCHGHLPLRTGVSGRAAVFSRSRPTRPVDEVDEDELSASQHRRTGDDPQRIRIILVLLHDEPASRVKVFDREGPCDPQAGIGQDTRPLEAGCRADRHLRRGGAWRDCPKGGGKEDGRSGTTGTCPKPGLYLPDRCRVRAKVVPFWSMASRRLSERPFALRPFSETRGNWSTKDAAKECPRRP